MRLFIVDAGGANYYVKAENPEQCAPLILAADGYELDGECEIREATQDELARLSIRDDDTNESGPPGSLWAAANELSEAHVVACSEWP